MECVIDPAREFESTAAANRAVAPIVSTTMCYPTANRPTRGAFVRQRLRAIHRLTPVVVAAPSPWYAAETRVTPGFDDTDGDPPVWRPRMYCIPRVLKRMDARCYARALDATIRRIARHNPIRLIDAHFEWPDGAGAWRAARRHGLPFVCTLRGKLVSQIAEPAKRRRIRDMLLGADALIAVSQSLADLADQVAGRSVRARVIPNGIDGAVFHRNGVAPEPDHVRACDARYVVSVGHVQELKGFHRLVDVWPEVRRRVGDVRLVLIGGDAGEPRYTGRLRRAIAELGRAGAKGRPGTDTNQESPDDGLILLTGRLPPSRVAAWLNAADLFVLASRSEGSCNAIAEALACGCPVVATDVGGNREIVTPTDLGTLVPFGDDAALADAICAGLNRRWDRDRIAEIGGRRTWEQVAAECLDVFEQAERR